MSAIKKFLALLLVGPIFVAVVAVLSLFLGAVAGWVGDRIFPEVFANLSELVFGKEIPGWQIGAMLGFVAAFLRSSFRPSGRKPLH